MMLKLQWVNEWIELPDKTLVPAAYFADGTIKICSRVLRGLKIYYFLHEIFHYLNHQLFDIEILDYIWDILDSVFSLHWGDIAKTREYYSNYKEKE